ncbi:DinB family protein [Thalassospira marina]|uniref:Damage-inducible protein DinB n=1 Tax=Thalassospira marina TaxID=2048283 RepID=A0ABM6Q7D2_9PROT|nr:DinB family protein [Thalassospira marina]AUG52423.1 hypothetical protein CSC3H3_06625 [Thalassospira marina]
MPLMDFDACGQVLARYNHWQNRIVFGLCAQMDDAARHTKRDLFFGTIHATLHHILYVDQRILTLLAGSNPGAYDPAQLPAPDFATLRCLREKTDAAILKCTDPDSPKDWQCKTFHQIEHDRVEGDRVGRNIIARDIPLQVYFLHMFNHQTHHRSQVTSALYQLGLDYGVTGMPFTPEMPQPTFENRNNHMPLMDFNACGRELARYNSWQNRVLFDLCDQIGDDARRADRGMFFGSIHATLNHILYIDQRITTLLKGGNPGAFTPTIIIADDFAELRKMREEMDAFLETLTDPENTGWQENIRTLADVTGKVRDVPLQVLYMQIFNHQTHHRSQITSELHKMGVDYGITDVPLTPGMPF